MRIKIRPVRWWLDDAERYRARSRPPAPPDEGCNYEAITADAHLPAAIARFCDIVKIRPLEFETLPPQRPMSDAFWRSVKFPQVKSFFAIGELVGSSGPPGRSTRSKEKP